MRQDEPFQIIFVERSKQQGDRLPAPRDDDRAIAGALGQIVAELRFDIFNGNALHRLTSSFPISSRLRSLIPIADTHTTDSTGRTS